METARCGRNRLLRWLRRAGAALPVDVPAGHVAVYVGSRSRRYVVRAAHLNHPAFRELLRQAEEEFGFSSGRPGPLSLPCDESLFEHVLRLLSASSSSPSCCFDVRRWLHAADSLPLLGGLRLSEKPVQ